MFIYDPSHRISVRAPFSRAKLVRWLLVMELTQPVLQAVDALNHPYFDDLDKAEIDVLESDIIKAREQGAQESV